MRQRVLARKPAPDTASVRQSSSGLKLSKPGDTFEQEADRVATAVTSGSRVPAWSIAKVSLGSVQRDTPIDPTQQQQDAPKPNNYDEAAKKAAEAFMQTDPGQKLKEAAKDDPLVRGATDFVSTLPGKIITGAVATGAVATLAATHKALPVQIPAIPLGVISPKLEGMSVKVDYEGPVDRPSKAMLTFSYSPGGDKKKSKESELDRNRAETARIAADMDKFRAGMTYKPGTPQAEQEQAEKKMIEDVALHRFGSALPGTGGRPLVPGAKTPADAPLQTPLDKHLDLKPAEAAPKISGDTEKKDEAAVQRKSSDSTMAYADSASLNQGLHSSSHALDAETRRFMESRIGHDFSKVKIHTGEPAARSARALGALAYTVGDSIVFSSGSYAPQSTEGRRLLAHELTHVVQQTGATKSPRAVQRKVVRNKVEMNPKDRRAFLKAHKWTNPAFASQVMEEMAAGDDAFDFADDDELKEEIVKRTSTVHHMEESQQQIPTKIPGDKRSAFGYPFNAASELYGPRVNYAAKDYWEPPVPDNYSLRTNKAKNAQLRSLPRSERCSVYGDQCGDYGWKLTGKGKSDPYHALGKLFVPQQPHKRTLIHCDYLISVVNFMSLADALGAAEFNKRIAAFGAEKIVLKWNAFLDLHDISFLRDPAGTRTSAPTAGLKSTQRVKPTSEKDIILGDHVVFFNHIAYDAINTGIGNAWRLENAVFVERERGQDVFLGHGSGYLTARAMKNKLAAEFNKVIGIAQTTITKTKSRDKKTQAAGQAELARKFPKVKPVGTEFHAVSDTGLGCTTNIDFKIREIKPDEVIGLKSPCNQAEMNEVERPIESAK